VRPDPPEQSVIDSYVEQWRRILRGVLGWDDWRFEEWVAGMGGVLYNAFLDHDHAAWYVAPLLIPDDLQRRLPDGATALLVRITSELSAGLATDDWADVRANIGSALAEHGAELPRG
jgi:hypothetical protein